MNLSSGDKFSNKKWKQYYDMDKEEITHWKDPEKDEGEDENKNDIEIGEGSIIGV